MPSNNRFTMSSRCKLLVDEVSELSHELSEDPKPHEALFFAETVKMPKTPLPAHSSSFRTIPTSFKSRLT
jgi:hypothetical protein